MWKWIAVSLLGVVCAAANAQFPDLKGLLGARPSPSSGVSDDQAAAGLKEALQVSTGKAVGLTGRKDGYFGNEAIRIAMPEKLRMVEKGLRAVGYGPKVDEFVLSMNRAAERAAPAAKDIFVAAIREMSFDDARRILGGGDTAATDYFREKTSGRLKASFRPVVEKSMQQSGVTQRYDDLMGRYKSIPFSGGVSFDVNDYVVDQALAGLFYMVAQQEKEIRTNPAARVTDLLKSVFGGR
ncbi:MAG TPA: DUF4197 domain-containing protein [Usitatibacter sp.]|nr:DUF4197 domain-containing protein [Usitatibacter sp.]